MQKKITYAYNNGIATVTIAAHFNRHMKHKNSKLQ